MHDVTVNGCYYAVYGYSKTTITNATITGSAHSGVYSGRTKIIGSTITGHPYYGVQAANTNGARAMIVNSTVTGNGTDAACADPTDCADVLSVRKPRVDGTTCNTSTGPSTTWGVCALD